MVRPGEDGLRYFIADIELAPGFKKAPEVVTARISYTLEGRRPRFSQVEVDGKLIPLARVSLSSLLEAYQRRGPVTG